VYFSDLPFLFAVDQSSIILPIEQHLAASLALIREDMVANPRTSKCMIFYPTARSAGLAAEVLGNIKGIPTVLEIHSRKSQPARIKAANSFKDASSAVLISSDVAARGMDFPGLVHVSYTLSLY
jgi:ATP-dependent RNA helicase MSS116, mitochondrial